MRAKHLSVQKERKKRSETLESETLVVRESFLATKSEVKRLFLSKQPLYLLVCKNYVLTTNTFNNHDLPPSVLSLL